jgi:hypothetical protein
MSDTVDMPATFIGSEAQRNKNRATHRFMGQDRCFECDSKMSHSAYDFPSGEEPPRVQMPYYLYDLYMDIKTAYLRKEITREQALEMQKLLHNSVE